MIEHAPQLVYKLRFLLITSLVLMSFILISLFLSAIKPDAVYQTQTSGEYVPSDSSNVVATGVSEFMYELSILGESMKHGSTIALIALTDAAEDGRQVIKNSAVFSLKIGFSVMKGAAQTVGSMLGFAANMTVSSLVTVLEIPGGVVGFLSNSAVMGSVIRPTDHAQVPIIDPESPALIEAKTAIAGSSGVLGQSQAADTPMWPIHGEVTTRFGVNHWPYQATHTGIDISDGQRPGVTPIHPFKSGTVIFAGRANNGLGNHIIIDHGNGVTSVYAHLSSISVAVGQVVNQSIVLGLEGTTGVSTGTHLHFEIRVNGMAADPTQFINGQP